MRINQHVELQAQDVQSNLHECRRDGPRRRQSQCLWPPLPRRTPRQRPPSRAQALPGSAACPQPCPATWAALRIHKLQSAPCVASNRLVEKCHTNPLFDQLVLPMCQQNASPFSTSPPKVEVRRRCFCRALGASLLKCCEDGRGALSRRRAAVAGGAPAHALNGEAVQHRVLGVSLMLIFPCLHTNRRAVGPCTADGGQTGMMYVPPVCLLHSTSDVSIWTTQL